MLDAVSMNSHKLTIKLTNRDITEKEMTLYCRLMKKADNLHKPNTTYFWISVWNAVIFILHLKYFTSFWSSRTKTLQEALSFFWSGHNFYKISAILQESSASCRLKNCSMSSSVTFSDIIFGPASAFVLFCSPFSFLSRILMVTVTKRIKYEWHVGQIWREQSGTKKCHTNH